MGIILLVGVVAYLITVVLDVLTATWPVLLALAAAVLAGHFVPFFRGDFIGLRALRPKSWFSRGARKGFSLLGVMLVAGLVSFAPARHVQLVQQHQVYLKEVARQEALERERQIEEARQATEKAQREREARQREAERKREAAEQERLRVIKAQAKAKQQAIDDARRAEERRLWEIERAKRDQQLEAERAAREAEREQEERASEEARRLEEGPFTSNQVDDMCWTAIKAKAADEGILATSGSNWGNYPRRWAVTNSWKWIPKVKLLSFDGEAVVQVECVVKDDGSVSTYFYRD